MDIFCIRGGTPLHGRIALHGAKNAALPLLAATLATAKEMGYDRVIAVHQPFTYSRTAMLLEQIPADNQRSAEVGRTSPLPW